MTSTRSPAAMSSGEFKSQSLTDSQTQGERGGNPNAAVAGPSGVASGGDSSPRLLRRDSVLLGRSPLHRAGLLQPYGYNASHEAPDVYDGRSTDPYSGRNTEHAHTRMHHPHSQDTIRQSSITLSNMPHMPLPPSMLSLSSSPQGIGPSEPHTGSPSPFTLSYAPRSGSLTPEDRTAKPSGLTLLRPEFHGSPSSDMSTNTPVPVATLPRNGTGDRVAPIPTDRIPEINILGDDNQEAQGNEHGSRHGRDEREHGHVHGQGQESEPDTVLNSADESERSTATSLTTSTLAPSRTSPAIGFHSHQTTHDPGPSGEARKDHVRSEVAGEHDALGKEPSISKKGTGETERTERTPLLSKPYIADGAARHASYDGQPINGPPRGSPSKDEPRHLLKRLRCGLTSVRSYVSNKTKTVKDDFSKSISVCSPRDVATTALKAIPAVLLGCLLNILDGVSYGMIIFPSTGIFSGLGPMGVSMFFATTIVAQLVYTLGGSGFAGANGSMMIEVVPFFHIMANSIANQIGEEHQRDILATTLVAYAFSSILTGLAFLLLGVLKLGVIVGFFPRHILVGCIGGVGVFLIQTGFTVSLRLDDSSFSEAPLDTIEYMFSSRHTIALWLIPLTLAVVLRLITYRWHHQLIFPIYFMIIPLVFYVIVLVARFDLDQLRKAGWLFDVGAGSEAAWYQFYSYLDFGKVHFGPLWKTLPTQFALLFFNILHPPLNVPALSVSLNEDVDTNRELVAHGISNLFAGLVGTVPNYLVYINTLLFYRVGGNNRIAGFMLALATFGLLLMGNGPIAYLPVMVVGALIFVLGIDLVKEALWDTRHRTSKTEYLTIVSIVVTMTIWDFVIGVLFGIIVSCFFFVVQSSQRKSIRTVQTGETAMSSVRRPSLQREYIREVSKQTTVIKLQGFLFFGTIAKVEETIRGLIDAPSWKHNPIRFLVVDLSLVAGVDMSSAEAFCRIQRILYNKGITLVFCGIQEDSPVGKALSSVEVLGAKGVELFSTLNDAMEWTENEYLRAWYNTQKTERAVAYDIPSHKQSDANIDPSVRSPRHIQLRDAATKTLVHEAKPQSHERDIVEEPFITLSKVFWTFGDFNYREFYPLKAYLQRVSLPPGHVLWRQGDPPDGLYVVESGVLRASYEFAEHTQNMEETMFPCTLAGELSGLSETPRNATITVERPAVLWKLSSENLRRLRREEPNLASAFTHLVLKSAKMDYDILLGALATRQ